MHWFTHLRHLCGLHHAAGASGAHMSSSWLVQPKHRHNAPWLQCNVTQNSKCGKGPSGALSFFFLHLKLTGKRRGNSCLHLYPAQPLAAARQTPATNGFTPGFYIRKPFASFYFLGWGPPRRLQSTPRLRKVCTYLWAKKGRQSTRIGNFKQAASIIRMHELLAWNVFSNLKISPSSQ